MKKILFSLVALMCTMSMSAQVLRVMKNGAEVAQYYGEDYEFVFEEQPEGPITTGTAKRTGNVYVRWIQLWENGPKFAEYNVGAANNKAEDYGGHYCWGGNIDNDPEENYKEGDSPLTGTYDTATNLWGGNWRMPTKEEFKDLLDNCDAVWTDDYKESGVKGIVFTGKGEYKNASVFFPIAGYSTRGNVHDQGNVGYYWSSTPNDSEYAYILRCEGDGLYEFDAMHEDGNSVRAVLAE